MKNLIYFTISHNSNYLKLLELCITSLIQTGYDGDILFITNFQNEISDKLKIKNNVLFFDPKESDFISSSANKLKIFQFHDIKNYDKIIFCDLDILWLKNPNEIFNTIEDGSLYFSEEGIDNRHNMSLGFYSENLINSEESNYMINNNIIGLNAGFFGFHINMLYVIEDIFMFMKENKHKISACLEQPFVNIHCFRNKLYKTDLTKYVSHRGQDLEKCDKHVLHFAGGVGNFIVKYEKMKKYLNNIQIQIFDTRKEMFETLPKNCKIMEIGVFKGEFSDFIFNIMKPCELHLIDLFEGMMDSGDVDGNNMMTINLNDSYTNLKNKYRDNSNVFIEKGTSESLLNKYSDDYFDIIYIDGDHSYDGVLKDLELSFKKIKNNGYICGHDYEMNNAKTSNNYIFGVKDAVDHFCQKYNLKISLKGNDGCVSYGILVFK